MPTFDQLPCPVLVTDRGGVVQSVNQSLLDLVGGVKGSWLTKPMDLMFPMASRIFLQTHVWPMLLRESRVREIRLQILGDAGTRVPVFVNCQETTLDANDRFTWVFFVTIERSRYEQELLEARQRAETMSADLAKSERFIRTVADAMPSMIAYWDTQLQCHFANKTYEDWFGRTRQEMMGLPISTLLGASLYEKNLPYIQGALAGEPQEFERAILRPDGSVGYALANYIPDINSNGSIQGFFALETNISRLREADAAIRLSASVFEATMEGILVTDTAAMIISVNPAFTALTGYTSEEVVGQNARILKSGRHDATFFGAMFQQLQATKLWKGEVWNNRKDGSIYLERLSISAICNEAGEVSRYVGVCADVTQQWDKEQLVLHMALHDGLTGLPNRSLLMERVGQLIALSTREPRHIALLFLDLDGFKLVNDTWGHEFGDRVLKAVSTRLLGLLRPSDTVARLGGDEFVILLNNPESRDNVAMIASRVIEEVNAPMSFDGKTAHVGTSIGIAFFTKEVTSPDDLLKNADDAMYEAKAAGKNTYRFSD
ncbi:MAG: diguanylate cyclase [Rhodoferax sp.]|uniref:sensor domain-containing protein n=1 Tax=Rhodoferax sp. TaxID=50421 RepID=UPI00182DF0AD|nr:diguanylate cyclase [Rhodoferax sp.]NMM14566.1 diguanylate cyclase [Rhodoferax sp.]